MSDFFAMGGYAVYVWPAVGVFLLAILADFLVPGVRRRRILKEIRAQQRRRQAKRGS